MSSKAASVLAELHRLADPKNVAGMARFGIVGKNLLGISMVHLRAVAKQSGRDHALAEALWSSGLFEARILAALVAEPAKVTRRQANTWARDFENWADCDGLCLHLFRKTAVSGVRASGRFHTT
jgi:3-methyladenine DNA glycosylase AlkD